MKKLLFLVVLQLTYVFIHAGLLQMCASDENCDNGCCQFGYCVKGDCNKLKTCTNSCDSDECCHLGKCYPASMCEQLSKKPACNNYTQCPSGYCNFGVCEKYEEYDSYRFEMPYYPCSWNTDCADGCCFSNMCMSQDVCTWAEATKYASNAPVMYFNDPPYAFMLGTWVYSPSDCLLDINDPRRCLNPIDFVVPDAWTQCNGDNDYCLNCCSKETGMCDSFANCHNFDPRSVRIIILCVVVPFILILICLGILFWYYLKRKRELKNKKDNYKSKIEKEKLERARKTQLPPGVTASPGYIDNATNPGIQPAKSPGNLELQNAKVPSMGSHEEKASLDPPTESYEFDQQQKNLLLKIDIL